MTIDETKIAPNLAELSHQTHRFVEGIQRLEFPDDRSIAVNAAAQLFQSQVDSIIEAMAVRSRQSEPVDSLISNKPMDKVTRRLDSLVTVFREDAATGMVQLPDMNDLAIGLTMFGMEREDLQSGLALSTINKPFKPSTRRTALMEWLTDVGVPVANVGITPVVLIKTLLIAYLTLLGDAVPTLQPLVIKAITSLNAVDRLAQDGPQGDDDSVVGDKGPVVGVGPAKSGDVRCDGTVTVVKQGKGPSRTKAINSAFRQALVEAANRCESGCIPILTRTRRAFFDQGSGKNGKPFSVIVGFDFKCVSPFG